MENNYTRPNCGGIVLQGQTGCDGCGTIFECGQEDNPDSSTLSTIYENKYRIREPSILGGFKNFLSSITTMFSGRVRRKEYWGTMLCRLLLLVPGVLFSFLLMASPIFMMLYRRLCIHNFFIYVDCHTTGFSISG